MAPTKALLKWKESEIEILVEMTNDQLELEAQDASMLISWTTHWKKVSSRLKEFGHNRTPTACRGIWRRGVQEQQANREAAGDEWDESEHEILVHMTKKQLDLEKADQANVIPWAKHWKKVSLQLDESGYVRTPENCAAYWSLVENDAIEDVSGLGGEDEDALDDVEEEDKSPEANAGVDDQEDALPSGPAIASPQASSKTSLWSLEEYESLLGLLKARRQLEADEGLEMLTGSKLWIEITESHRANGFDRSWEACKTYWNKQGRERSGYDERVKLSPKSSTLSAIQPNAESSTTNSSTSSNANSSSDRSLPSSLSSLWSPVNEAGVEEAIVVSRNPAIDVLKKYQEDRSFDNHVSPSLNSTLPKSTGPVVNDIGPDQEHSQAQEKRETSVNSATPTQPAVPEKTSSAVKYGLTSFRFTPEQRAVLEAEALRTGGTLDGTRKAELAEELGVEEKTVRNWFNNYNVKARRSQGSTPGAPVPTPTYEDFHESRKYANSQAAASPTPLSQGFLEFRGVIPKRPYPDDDTPDHSRPPKKTQLEAQIESFRAAQGFNPVNANSSRHTSHEYSPAAPTRRPNSRHSTLRAEDMDGRSNGDTTNQLSNGTSATPPRAVQTSDGFTAILKNSAEGSVPPSHLQLKSDPQPILNPESQQMVPNLVNQQPPTRSPQTTTTAYPSILCDNDNMQTSNNSANTVQTKIPGPTPQNVYKPYIWSKEPKAHGAAAEPRLETKTSEPTASVLESKDPSPSVTDATQTSFDRHRAWQFLTMGEKQKDHSADAEKRTSISPITTHTPSAQPPANMQPEHVYTAPKPITTPVPIQDPSTRSRTASTPSDEHSKMSALQHVENFRAEIHNLNQANAARTTRVASLSQELSNYSSKHVELNAAKDAEIARALKEIETRYEGLHMGLRQHEEWLGKETAAEVEGLKKNTAELSRKEKGLARWQGVVDYYDNEGEEEL